MTIEKHHFYLIDDTARRNAAQFCMESPHGWHMVGSEPTRTLDQNAAQWPYLEGFSKQLQWPVNGRMETLSRDEWKDILTAAFLKETTPRLAAGIDGGVVMLGQRTSKFGKKQFSLWMEFLIAVAALRGVTPIYKSYRYAELEGATA